MKMEVIFNKIVLLHFQVYETVSGALVNVETALKAGATLYCKICEKNGATVKCWKVRCTNAYHVGCATKDRAMFYQNKSVYCNQHHPKVRKKERRKKKKA